MKPLLPTLATGLILLAYMPATTAAALHVRPLKLAGIPAPAIDGSLEDKAWTDAPAIEKFTQVELDEGAAPTEKTVVKLLYDPENLYIGIRCHDAEPDKIVAHQLNRDASLGSDDYVNLVIDTFHNYRSGYFFMINPRGAKTDGMLGKQSSGRTSSQWDGIWEGRARVDDQGWTAEIALPYKTLSFDPAGDTWGFNIERKIIRKNERIRWNNPVRDDKVSSLRDLGELRGLEGLQQGLGIDFKPYMTLANRRDAEAETQAYDFDTGFDLFYKFTPAVTGSLSLNMDFAETESDLRRVNLSRYPLFFPEKRDFFLQDSNIFSFGASHSVMPFFSRRIGLDSDGNPVGIQAAGKLSGRMGRVNFGILDAQLENQPGLGSKNLGVARATLDVGEESNVGIIATHGDPTDAGNNSLLGIDANLHNTSFGARGMNFSTNFLAVGTRDDGQAGAPPGAFGVMANLNDDVHYTFAGAYQVDDAFNPALGYIREHGIRQYYAFYRHRIRPQGQRIDYVDFELDTRMATDLGNRIDNWDLEPGIEIETKAGDEFEMILATDRENLAQDFEITDSFTIPADDYLFTRLEMSFESSSHRRLAIETELGLGEFFDGERSSYEGSVIWRPTPRLSLSSSLRQNDIELPDAEFTTRVATARANLKFTPDIGWSTLAQYDNLSESIGINSRLHWIVEPGNEVYLVLNQGADIQDNWRATTHESKIKLAWTLRY